MNFHKVTIEGNDYEGATVLQDGIPVADLSSGEECYIAPMVKRDTYYTTDRAIARFKYSNHFVCARSWCKWVFSRMTMEEVKEALKTTNPSALAEGLGWVHPNVRLCRRWERREVAAKSAFVHMVAAR